MKHIFCLQQNMECTCRGERKFGGREMIHTTDKAIKFSVSETQLLPLVSTFFLCLPFRHKRCILAVTFVVCCALCLVCCLPCAVCCVL